MDFWKAIDKGESELRHGPDSAADEENSFVTERKDLQQVPYRRSCIMKLWQESTGAYK